MGFCAGAALSLDDGLSIECMSGTFRNYTIMLVHNVSPIGLVLDEFFGSLVRGFTPTTASVDCIVRGRNLLSL